REGAGGGDDGLVVLDRQAPLRREQVHRVLVVLGGRHHAEPGAHRPEETAHLLVAHGAELETHSPSLSRRRAGPLGYSGWLVGPRRLSSGDPGRLWHPAPPEGGGG